MLTIHPQLARACNITGYAEDGIIKADFHRQGKAFLRSLAKELGLKLGTYDVRSNQGGPAVSGEVTLHSETLYVQLSESCMTRGVGILYRSCRGVSDYTGGQNNWAILRQVAEDAGYRATFITRLRSLGGLA